MRSGRSSWRVVRDSDGRPDALVYGKPVASSSPPWAPNGRSCNRRCDRIAPLVPLDRTLVIVSRADAAIARRQLVGIPACGSCFNRAHGAPPRGFCCRSPRCWPGIPGRWWPSFLRPPVSPRRPVPRGSPSRGHGDQVRSERDRAHRRGSHRGDRRLRLNLPAPPPSAAARPVQRFVEKPPAEVTQELLARGALLNTMVMVARGAALWKVARRCMPRVTSRWIAIARPSALRWPSRSSTRSSRRCRHPTSAVTSCRRHRA